MILILHLRIEKSAKHFVDGSDEVHQFVGRNFSDDFVVVGVVDDVDLIDVGLFDVLELKTSVEDHRHLLSFVDGGFDVLFRILLPVRLAIHSSLQTL